MKTYRNEQQGFEIDIPEEWSLHTEGQGSLIFKCRPNEAFNIQVRPLTIIPFLYQIENEFKRDAEKKGFTSLGLGRFHVGGEEHISARFYIGGGLWSKKYRVILRGFEYMITATCLEEKYLLEMEKGWDEVVASFRVLKPIDDALGHEHEVGESKVQTDDHSPTVSKDTGAPMPRMGMKTYGNKKHGFEIDIPENWSPAPTILQGLASVLAGPPPSGVNKDCFQYGCYEEAFNFEIGPLFPEPLLDDTEIEFRLYARNLGFMDLHFGRVTVAGKEHVCAHYFINDKMGKRWNKKYMIVFGGVEYTITGTCNEPQYFTKREKDWDAIIQSFRLFKPVDDSANFTDKAERYRNRRREIIQQRIDMREVTGDLYARAYEAVAVGQFREARTLLEKCLQENPSHVLAHKEMAVVLEKLGDIKRALHHRKEVQRLAPDDLINRSKLDDLLAGSGKKSEALQDVQESLKMMPGHPIFQELEKKLTKSRFPDYRLTFISSLICLLLADISFFFPEYIAISNVWCMSLLMLMPTWGVWVSGPWVGIPRNVSGLIAGMLYLFFLINVW